jgi:hypothetical protein
MAGLTVCVVLTAGVLLSNADYCILLFRRKLPLLADTLIHQTKIDLLNSAAVV